MTVYVADGTVFARGDAAIPTELFVPINQIRTIAPVGSERGLIDVTNLQSDAREYMKAIKDGQEIELEIQYDPDDLGHGLLRADCDGEVAHNYQISLSDAGPQTITFAGHVINWSLSGIEIDNVVTLNVTIKPTGNLVFSV